MFAKHLADAIHELPMHGTHPVILRGSARPKQLASAGHGTQSGGCAQSRQSIFDIAAVDCRSASMRLDERDRPDQKLMRSKSFITGACGKDNTLRAYKFSSAKPKPCF